MKAVFVLTTGLLAIGLVFMVYVHLLLGPLRMAPRWFGWATAFSVVVVVGYLVGYPVARAARAMFRGRGAERLQTPEGSPRPSPSIPLTRGPSRLGSTISR